MILLAILSQTKELTFEEVKNFVSEKIEKYTYFKVDSNFIKRIKITQSFEELVSVLDSFRKHLGQFDYLGILKDEELHKEYKEKRNDYGLTKGGRVIPTSPSFRKCAFLTGQYVYAEYTADYMESGICTHGKSAYISSGKLTFLTVLYVASALKYDTIIIDLRDNFGGESIYAYYIASLLSNKKQIDFKYLFRDTTIIEKKDFSSLKTSDVRKKKIIILSNKNTYSASEWLIYKLASLNPKITLVNPDGRTGGKRTRLCSFYFYYNYKDYYLLVPCGLWFVEGNVYFSKNY
jgi:hypothetical protein